MRQTRLTRAERRQSPRNRARAAALIGVAATAWAASAANAQESAPGTRIISGVPAVSGMWPYQVSMIKFDEKENASACGGTVIHPYWVLTAAHCLGNAADNGPVAPKSVFVQFNSVKRIAAKSGAPKARAVKLVIHPGYRFDSRLGVSQDDIALVKVNRPMRVPLVRLAHEAIARPLEKPRQRAVIIGWGKTESGKGSKILLQASVPILPLSSCQRTLRGAESIIDRDVICAEGSDRGGVCSGDSGGPIFTKGPDKRYYQVGVVSFGHKNCRKRFPNVFTRVSAYIPWMKRHVPDLRLERLEDPRPPAAPSSRALLIGVDKYRNPEFDLKGSVEDTRLMADLMRTRYKLDKKNIKVLTNENATRAAILSAIKDWLIAGSAPNARLYLHFSGHGYHQPDQDGDEIDDNFDELLLPHDVARNPAGGLKNVIVDDELRDLFSKLGGRRLIVTIDSCYSGTMTRSVSDPANADFTRMPTREGMGRAMPIRPGLTRSAKLETVFEKIDGNVITWSASSPSQLAMVDKDAETYRGVFTARFVEGIANRAADGNKDGKVTGAELLDYVTAESQSYCADHPDQCPFGITPRLEGPAWVLGADVVTQTQVRTGGQGGAGQAPAPSAPSQTPTPAPAPGQSPAPAPGGPPPVASNPQAPILGRNTARIDLRIEPGEQLAIGGKGRFSIESEVGGDLILFEKDPSGRVRILLPDPSKAIDRYRIPARQRRTVPDSAETGYAWFDIEGPVGNYRLYAVISEAPIDYVRLQRAAETTDPADFTNTLLKELRKTVIGPDGAVGRSRFSVADVFYEVVQ